MLAEEVEVLELLITAGSGLEEFELTDELLREHQLIPSLDAEVVMGGSIGAQGSRPVSFAFEVAVTNSH